MIQPIKSSKVFWLVHWLDLDQPVPGAAGYFLPTVLFVTDGRGRPVGPPAVFEELDQARVESMLLRLFETEGAPDRVLVAASDEWDARDWESFAKEQEVDVRIQQVMQTASTEAPAFSATLTAQAADIEPVQPADLARSLVRSALRLRSAAKKEAQFRRALAADPDCSPARIELADIEFHRGNWKACLAAYEDVIARENRRWRKASPRWWQDRDTRPYLRALYGRAMTLWHRGRYAEAASQLEKLVAINPADNQGARLFVPLLHLLAEDFPSAAAAFRSYAANYPKDFAEPAMLFGWGLSLAIEGDEAGARAKYRDGMLRNIYIAPLLIEEPLPTQNLWMPNDRAEYPYASEFIDSYAVLWDRESGAMRLLREVWETARPAVNALVAHRETMLDFQDQRYEPGYKALWQRLLDEDERLSSAG